MTFGREDSQMPDWKVFYRDQHDQDRACEGIPSREAALRRAKDLYRQRSALYRIEGPNGKIMLKNEIMSWVSDNKY
jgi:1,2-phenylacetyl-CoA epoxidase PaaB subunit